MPSDAVGVSEPLQLSEAVAPPNAVLIVAVDGLHPSVVDEVELGVTTGLVTSIVQVAVRETVAVLLQASDAVNVLVWLLLHPVDPTTPSVTVMTGVPQASVAVPVPNAASIAVAVGLQPTDTVA
jgi:hypothetical protein